MPVGVTGHRTQRPRGQVGPPGPHPAQPSSSLDPGGERWPIFRPLAPLIAQLVQVPRLKAWWRCVASSMGEPKEGMASRRAGLNIMLEAAV